MSKRGSFSNKLRKFLSGKECLKSEDKSTTLQAEIVALDQKIYGSLKVWIDQKNRLPSCKLAAMNFGHFLCFSQELELMQM